MSYFYNDTQNTREGITNAPPPPPNMSNFSESIGDFP
jgi:hypothetical protein